jgi:hypothetical protein
MIPALPPSSSSRRFLENQLLFLKFIVEVQHVHRSLRMRDSNSVATSLMVLSKGTGKTQAADSAGWKL